MSLLDLLTSSETIIHDNRGSFSATELVSHARVYGVALERALPSRAGLLHRPKGSVQDLVSFFGTIAANRVPFIADPGWPDLMVAEMAEAYGLYRDAGDDGLALPPAAVAEFDPLVSFVRFSSGSSGRPKALAFGPYAARNAGVAWSRAAGYGPSDRILCLAPLSNGLCFNACLMSAVAAGAQLYLYSGILAPSAIMRFARRVDPTVVAAFPVGLDLLAKRGSDLASSMPSLRLILSAGAPLSKLTESLLTTHVGRCVGDYYGLAEAGPVTFNSGSVNSSGQGHLLPDAHILCDGEECVNGKEGRLAVRTSSLALGTISKSGCLEALPLLDGHYLTSDIGRLTSNHSLTLLGRCDSVVLLGSEKIDLAEIEQVLRQIDGVDDAYVFINSSNAATPYVSTLVETSSRSVEQIRSSCAERLSWSRMPARIVAVGKLPRSSSGKIIREMVDALFREATA